MARRAIGVLLLFVVAVAAAVVPGLRGQVVAGLPVAAQVPGPPRPGQCVTGGLGDPRLNSPSGTLAAPEYGPCTGEIRGQVISIQQVEQNGANVIGTLSDFDQALNSCPLRAQTAVGLMPLTGGGPLVWMPSVLITGVPVGPDAVQRAAGQNWIGCVAMAADGAAFRGSLIGAMTSGSLPDAFGMCLGRPYPGTVPVPCSAPHVLQLLATSVIDPGASITNTQISATCQRVAAVLLRRPDPTARGVLTITGARSATSDDFATCIASAPRPLAGSLIGFGSRPLPWAG